MKDPTFNLAPSEHGTSRSLVGDLVLNEYNPLLQSHERFTRQYFGNATNEYKPSNKKYANINHLKGDQDLLDNNFVDEK